MVLASECIKQVSYSDSWGEVKDKLKAEHGVATFNSWLCHLSFVESDNKRVTLSAPTRFIREWVSNNYTPSILGAWREYAPSIEQVEIIVKPHLNEVKISHGNSTITGKNASGVDVIGQNVSVIGIAANDSEYDFGSPLDRRFTFESFVVGETNMLAYNAAKAFAENNPDIVNRSLLFIHGNVGLGKTHLLHAIAQKIRETQPGRKVAYLSSEKFMYQFIKAIKDKDIMSFKDRFRSIDVLLIDDIQFICGKQSTQEEFFHTLNSLIDDKKQLIISGDKSPQAMEGLDERIKSRLCGGLTADIGTTDYQLRFEILKSKVSNFNNKKIDEKILEFIASKVSSSIRELEGALNKVVAHSTLMGKPVTLAGCQQILADILKASEKVVTIDEIQKKVAGYFNIKITDMSSAMRIRSIARPRQIAMYLAKELTSRSLSEIGRKFGGKDHTTVMHAVKKVAQLIKSDSEFKEDVSILSNMIRL